MVNLIDVHKSVEKRIKQALIGTSFSTIELTPEDITENFPRPSIKVRLENSTNGKYNSTCREKTLTYRVYFFAKDRYKPAIDNMKMQDIIENTLLEDLEVIEDFFIPIENVNSEVSDGVLICSFDLYCVELLPDTDTSEMMETLNIII